MLKRLLHVVAQYLKTKYGRRFRTRKELERWQEQKVEKHVTWVLAHSPFYQEWLKDYSIKDWRQFPIINKQIMMDQFLQFNTVGVTKEEAFSLAFQSEETRDFSGKTQGISVGLSSGTSGNRGLFLVRDEESWQWVGAMLAKVLPNSIFGKCRIALFLRANNNLYTSLTSNRIHFQFFDLLTPLKEHVSKIQEYQPTILVAPPSVLRMLAKMQMEQKVNLHLQKVISVAEVLDPLDEQLISKGFGQIVHQIYQCTEGFLATTCSHGTLHLNEDLVVIQKKYLDRQKRKFSPIITDFCRTSQPIIRYGLDDILTERAEPCPCGSVYTAIEQIEGRCDDLFYFPHRTEQQNVTIYPDFIRRAVISADSRIEEYRVLQLADDELVIQLKVSDSNKLEVQQLIEESMKALCDQLECILPKIRWSEYEWQTGAKKLRRVERMYG
ncbi:F390 synthetase-related protein [Risungbinella massiliensis]|uniref:F390 synthetase-related protein n=1 Tax=Risungbinella massiliensis TaxID=1329796 RepID=UPI0005CC6C0A|nr:F390 synthetase-related protein [Risungbinella massiliensis]